MSASPSDGIRPVPARQSIATWLGAAQQLRLAELDAAFVDRGPLDPADAHEILARHVAALARRALRAVPGDDGAALGRQVALANQIAEAIIALAPDVATESDLVAETRDLLQAIAPPADVPGPVRFPARPEVPLSMSALLVNGRHQPRIGIEVQNELASADRVDLLCAWVLCRDSRIVGYYALAMGSVEHRSAPSRLRRGQPDPIPVLLLARLALDRSEQGHGLGADLLQDALIRAVAGARQYGARAVIVDAIDDRSAAFYARHGFLPLGGRRLYRRTTDIDRALQGLTDRRWSGLTVPVTASS